MKIHFNLEKFGIDTKDRKFTYNGKEYSVSVIISLLSVIVLKYLYNNRLIVGNDGVVLYPTQVSEGFEIHNSKFKKIASNDYKIYLQLFLDKRIILINTSYVVGEKSRTYYLTDYFKKHSIISDVTPDNKKFQRFVTTKVVIPKDTLRKLEKDYSDAIVCSWDIKKELKDDGFIDYRNYLTNCINCFAIARKTGYFKIADPNKRIYTNFVSLSDNIRLNNISFGQDQLTTNDIPSSFPLFFSLWVVSQGIAKENPELKEFVRGLNCGEFYDHLCTKLNNNKDLNPDREYAKKPYKRNDAKQLFQVWLNGKNVNTSGAITNTDINYVMDRYYPDIMAVFLGAKTESNSIYFILENLEAQFIFNTICKRLYSEIPGIKIITCHDAIYYEKCFEHQVQPIWKEELNKLYGNLIFDPDDDGYYKKSRKKVRKDKSVIDFDDVFGLTDEEATVIEEIKVTTNNIDLFFDDGSYPKEDPFKKLINDYKLPDNFYNFPKKKRLFDHEELFDDYNEDDVDDDIDPWEDTPPDEDDDSGFLLY